METPRRAVRFLLYALWLHTLPTGVAGAAQVGGVSLETECIDEPVFGGTACVYQANTGAKEAVVLVHGLNGEALRDWREQIPLLAKRYHVVTFDLPGFGRSEKRNALYSPENYARFVHHVTRQFVGRPFHLVGHSMGAAISAEYAARYPEDVRRLLLTDSAGILYGLIIAEYAAGAWMNRMAGREPDAANAFGRIVGKVLEELDELPLKPERLLDDKESRRRYFRANPGVIAGAALATADFGAVLPAVQAPTLIIWGSRDFTVPVRTGRVLEQLIPRARLEVITGAGHIPMHQTPEVYNELLWRHLTAAESEMVFSRKLTFRDVPPPTKRVGRCEGRRHARFTGSYRRLELSDCERVTIDSAWIGSIKARSSRIDIRNSSVVSGDVAMAVEGSDVTMTNCRVQGRVALQVSRSRLDVANTELVGEEAAARGRGSSVVVFSVSRLQSPHHARPIHGHRIITSDEPL